MTMTATDPIGVAIQKLAELVSESTTFQTRCGVSTAAAALAFIHYPHLLDPNECERPFVVIKPPKSGAHDMYRTTGGGMNGLLNRGTLELYIGDEIDDFDDEKDPEIDFGNFEGAIITHLRSQAAVDDNLAISGMRCTMPRSRSSDLDVSGSKVQKPFYMSVWLIDWDQC
jgi:hypothetical protein